MKIACARFGFPQFFLVCVLIVASSCGDDEIVPQWVAPTLPSNISLSESFFYHIDLNDRSGDSFKVKLLVGDLTSDNNLFQFPAVVPGTYRISDYGRFVEDFRAFDEDLNQLETKPFSQNQWEITTPEKAYLISYRVADSWDSNVLTDPVLSMAGTSIENDHALLNPFAVMGYPRGLKERNYYVDLEYPESWTLGTSLDRIDGVYWAEDYDKLVDSPMLLGNLSQSTIQIDNANINVYTYSENELLSSSIILSGITQTLRDASEFLMGLPVDRYNFLFLFPSQSLSGYGALEHSLSSVYVLPELPYSNFSRSVVGISAHEFFHIVTPLNIHSEIIQGFDFEVPTPSEHLWLYEGVTEWAAIMMSYRNGSLSLNTLLDNFEWKINLDDSVFNNSYSLSDISLTSYTPQGLAQFGNVYNRGAITAALLDIRLLELSHGEKGLRELILKLMEIYGPNKFFLDRDFFEIVTFMTYPEIEDFIQEHIKENQELPIAIYFEKLGILYDPGENSLSLSQNMSDNQQFMFDRWSRNF